MNIFLKKRLHIFIINCQAWRQLFQVKIASKMEDCRNFLRYTSSSHWQLLFDRSFECLIAVFFYFVFFVLDTLETFRDIVYESLDMIALWVTKCVISYYSEKRSRYK